MKIKDINVYYGAIHAIKGISLEVNEGEIVILIGANGAGKSSLMRTIATLQSADTGSINFAGIDVLHNPNALRQTLGYLPQDFNVYPRISAFDLLDHLAVLKGLNQKKARHETVNALLAHTNLYGHKDKAVSSFSGGMRQRFGIAQALLGDPKLLIVDEPTAGLDPEERNRFHNLLVSLGEEKVIILSTHIVDDVAELCPNMAVLAGGKILLQGNPLDLVGELQGQVWSKTVSQAEAQELEAQLPVISKRLFAGRTVLNVFAISQPEGFNPVAANLEDVYFSTLFNARQRQSA